jgi:hypothetical protein
MDEMRRATALNEKKERKKVKHNNFQFHKTNFLRSKKLN